MEPTPLITPDNICAELEESSKTPALLMLLAYVPAVELLDNFPDPVSSSVPAAIVVAPL